MEHRALGRSGVDVSRIILGCGNFGGIGSSPAFFGAGETEAEAHTLLSATLRALAELPQEQREVVALVLIEGMPYREAAEVLDVPIGTVTSRLARARDSLAARVLGGDLAEDVLQ